MPRPKGAKNKYPSPKKKSKIKVDALTCVMCGKSQQATMHYQSFNPLHATGYLPYCKPCLKKMSFDSRGNIDVERVKQMLRMIDRPFLYDLFYASVLGTETGDAIGTYMKNLALPQYRYCTWSNSNFDSQAKAEQKINTVVTITDDVVEMFGVGYQTDEYMAMLKKYNFLKNNYPDVTNLHVEALVTYVRYKVKEEFAVASGDVGAAKQWAELSMKAAEKAKIQPSQLSKADLQGGLNSFGELIKAVETAVDIIPILPQFKYRPNDALDFVIWCYVNYIRDLKGLPVCDYKDVYSFYDKRKQEYVEQYGDPYNIFKNDPTLENREKIAKFVSNSDDETVNTAPRKKTKKDGVS